MSEIDYSSYDPHIKTSDRDFSFLQKKYESDRKFSLEVLIDNIRLLKNRVEKSDFINNHSLFLYLQENNFQPPDFFRKRIYFSLDNDEKYVIRKVSGIYIKRKYFNRFQSTFLSEGIYPIKDIELFKNILFPILSVLNKNEKELFLDKFESIKNQHDLFLLLLNSCDDINQIIVSEKYSLFKNNKDSDNYDSRKEIILDACENISNTKITNSRFLSLSKKISNLNDLNFIHQIVNKKLNLLDKLYL